MALKKGEVEVRHLVDEEWDYWIEIVGAVKRGEGVRRRSGGVRLLSLRDEVDVCHGSEERGLLMRFVSVKELRGALNCIARIERGFVGGEKKDGSC
mmetsp:Transcript_13467/g.22547  ORF Transcript_13467/g.22547 Transcript_13467/m.22547 type:complete len:96 (-) Transcript_13467:127-414(-)